MHSFRPGARLSPSKREHPSPAHPSIVLGGHSSVIMPKITSPRRLTRSGQIPSYSTDSLYVRIRGKRKPPAPPAFSLSDLLLLTLPPKTEPPRRAKSKKRAWTSDRWPSRIAAAAKAAEQRKAADQALAVRRLAYLPLNVGEMALLRSERKRGTSEDILSESQACSSLTAVPSWTDELAELGLSSLD